MERIEEVLSNFRNPPPGYGIIHWWILSGEVYERRISEELDEIRNLGISSVLIAAGHGVNPRYLSEEWFKMIKFAVREARARNMLVWLADEGGYPSGFAGDVFKLKYPDLRMKALIIGEKINVQGGQKVDFLVPEKTIGALAVNTANGNSMPLDISSGRINWVAPEGHWQIWLVQQSFCTSPTRYVHHPTGAKDTTFPLCDYLNPKAVSVFLSEVHEKYKRYIGSEFGRVVLGFFGDEPDYSIPGIPWTENIFEEFKKIKGYDVQPFIPLFFSKVIPEEAVRAKADYWDVWSKIFSETFFRLQFEWCEKNNLLYTVHLNHEDDMRLLIRSEGDFFRCMRYVHVPAIDVIWRQIWMDKTADFPKLASSVAHIYGRRFVLSESFAVYGTGLSLEQAKWVIDHQFVRGINLILTSIFMPKHLNNPQSIYFNKLIQYAKRASFLLCLGQPSAQIALYYPTRELWMGNDDADKKVWSIVRQLLENQRDFDFVDEESLLAVLKIEGGALRNLSGQVYKTIIIPPINVLSRKLLERLKDFARSGGQVIFLGFKSPMIIDDSFMRVESRKEDFNWFICLPDEEINSHLLEILPEPDVSLDRFLPMVKYLHSRWHDIDIYFFFNEGEEKIRCKATVEGKGSVQIWDAELGQNISLEGRQIASNKVNFLLELEPYETKFILVGPSMPKAESQRTLLEPLGTLLDLSEDWTIEIDGKKYTSSNLKYWSELGYPSYSGAVIYRKEFRLPLKEIPEDTRIFLECKNVYYSARAWLNNIYLGERAWRPFRWDLTKALRPNVNFLEIEVRNTPAAAFAGDPATLEKLKEESKRGGYLAIFLKFDIEMLPSGLLPPVKIVVYREIRE
ncbi:glycoside hydrolase [Candidatus Bathyarchaeota archaeon]|nr:glycoside hydrolase [Candidatus Bathyarchaeota archaeon]